MLAMGALACASRLAEAQWPSDPESPLVLGDTTAIVQLNRSMALAPDGAMWVTWIDLYCQGNIRIQRVEPDGSLLVPSGLVAALDPSCGTGTPPHLAACTDGAAVLCLATGQLTDTPLLRIAPNGASQWHPPLVIESKTAGSIAGLIAVSDGGVIAGLHLGSSVGAVRYNASGEMIWMHSVATISGSNKRMLAVISDGADGAIAVWDEPLSYKRRIVAARFTADGQAPWGQPLLVVPAEPGSSLHTLPAVMADGTGGAIVVWTFPNEQPQVQVPLLMQRITPQGELAFDPQGQRISMQFTRQFDPLLAQDAPTGDIFVAWRDGDFTAQSLRVQRMTLAGARLWGDDGVGVTPIAVGHFSSFDPVWIGETLFLPVADTPSDPAEPRVHVHRVDGAGVLAAEPWAVSSTSPVRMVRALSIDDDSLAVTWLDDQPDLDDEVVAQRVNVDGTLGLPQAADITGDGVVNIDDLLAVIAAWGPCAAPPALCPADVAIDGQVNIDDLLLVISSWG